MKNGYYSYDSEINAAWFNPETEQFEVYNAALAPYNKTTTVQGHFLPFNKFNSDIAEKYGTLTDSDNNEIPVYRLKGTDNQSRADMWFGMYASMNFYQPKDGKLNNEDMLFDFRGDDDVWVFIDGILALDIGGRHGALRGNINFATGEVYSQKDEKNPTTTLKAQYEAAYAEMVANGLSNTEQAKKIKDVLDNGFKSIKYTDDSGAEKTGWIYKDYSDHRFDFFYLERGGGSSNCKLEFNMDPLPKGLMTVKKVEENLNQFLCGRKDYQFKLTDSSNKAVPNARYSSNLKDGATDADGIFYLRGGETAVFNSVDVSKTYTVTELTTGYTTTVVGGEINGQSSTVTISDDGIARNIQFTNAWDTETLEISKDVIGKIDIDRDYIFDLNLANSSLNLASSPYSGSASGAMTSVENGVVTLSDDESITISGLPAGTTFTVSEADPSNGEFNYENPLYRLSTDSADIEKKFSTAVTAENKAESQYTGTLDTSKTVIITNRCRVDLKITKTGCNETIDPHQTFIFDIYQVNGEAKTHYMTVKTVGDETVTVKDLPVGIYEIAEDSEWSWRYNDEKYEKCSFEVDLSKATTDMTDITSVKQVDLKDGNIQILVTNNRAETLWMDGNAYGFNVFGANATENINGVITSRAKVQTPTANLAVMLTELFKQDEDEEADE